ncbi:hypothetical protein AHF37_08350 [Paragonimus kellicotti]|nr:hypothetical protein AHF37_08350 [Paragonimus kellicotti]
MLKANLLTMLYLGNVVVHKDGFLDIVAHQPRALKLPKRTLMRAMATYRPQSFTGNPLGSREDFDVRFVRVEAFVL